MKLSIFANHKSEGPVRRRRLTDDISRQPIEEQLPSYSYRRNATIANTEQSTRTKSHDLRRQQRSYGLLLLMALLVAGIVTILLYQFSGSVSTSIYGQVSHSEDESNTKYVEAINAYLNHRPLERLRILTDPVATVQYLQSNGLPEIEAVTDIRPTGLGASHFTLKMRQPVATWTLDKQQYFVDKNGVIFSNNYFDNPVVKINDQSGLSEAMSGQVLTVTSKRFLDFIGQSVGRLEEQGLIVHEVIIPPNTTRMVEMKLSGGLLVRMTVDRSVGEQVEDATRAVKFANQDKMRLHYIDVRVSGKAFYKTK